MIKKSLNNNKFFLTEWVKISENAKNVVTNVSHISDNKITVATVIKSYYFFSTKKYLKLINKKKIRHRIKEKKVNEVKT